MYNIKIYTYIYAQHDTISSCVRVQGMEMTVYTSASSTNPAEMRTITAYASDGSASFSPALVASPVASSSTYIIQSIASAVFGSSGAWDQTTGSLTLTVAAGKTMYANVTYALSITVTNAATAQAAPAVSISASGSETITASAVHAVSGSVLTTRASHPGKNYASVPQLYVSSSSLCACGGSPGTVIGVMDRCLRASLAFGAVITFKRAHGAVIKAMRASGALLVPRLGGSVVPRSRLQHDTRGVPTVSGAVPSPVAGDAAPIKVYAPAFTVRNIGQSTPNPGSTNTLTMTLTTNVATLTTSTIVTVSGLRGASGTTGPIVISSAAFSNVAGGATSTASYDDASKTLTLFAATPLTAFTMYVVSFELTNALREQPSPEIQVEASGPVPISRVPMIKDLTRLLTDIPAAVPGDAAPLRLYGPKFLVKRIGQMTAWPCVQCGARNIVGVTLSVNIALSSLTSSVITISGLVGSQTADTGGRTVLLAPATAAATSLSVDESSSAIDSPEGVRLLVGDGVLIDEWQTYATALIATIGLREGVLYDIALEYRDVAGKARVVLQWRRDPSQTYTVVPSELLYHSAQLVAGPYTLCTEAVGCP
jgi:hypothetical protein